MTTASHPQSNNKGIPTAYGSTVEVPKSRVADMGWLYSFILQHRFAALASLVFGAIGGITLALEPYLVGAIIDRIRVSVDMTQITHDVLLLVGLSIVSVVAFFGQRYYSGVVAYAVHFDIRKAVFDHMVTLDDEFYKRYATGDLISRMYADLDWVWRLLALGFNRGGSAAVVAVLAFVLLATVNLPLTVVVFIALAANTFLQIRAGLFLIPISKKVQDQAGVLSALMQDTVTGIETIKTFGKEEGVSKAFYDQNKEYRRIWLFFKRRNEPVGMLPQMMIQLTTGLIVIVGGGMAVEGQITLGNFAQFLLYLGLIRQVMLQLGTIYQRGLQVRGAMERITPLLQEPIIKDSEQAKALSTPRGDIFLENVSYKVDDNWLLRDINLDIPAGTVIGLVGATGCGKTTLINLLARVMDPTTGDVYIDGDNLRDLRLDDIRKAISFVPQSTFLFSQPLHENVRMGKPDLREDELERAVHISRLSNDLPQMPLGLDTMVGEKGVMLSGGQKQRVAIARAIARDPAILVLDDALSSVDTRTAAEILGDMRHVLNTRTSIIIAHRMATVKDADRIIVMEGGCIVEDGTHDELIALGGLYTQMVEREKLADDESEVSA
ncbi:MAG: ABC transporter ATP-binding protein [Anaerolineae bacterium]|nr:ABC transporter ATP-binding protein [Anaerolineae bacterium]MCA9895243.1 ABC transporter ATP-binding protein [Anaerolineae bacterium]